MGDDQGGAQQLRSPSPIDTVALVADIQTEVARRRAAGEYPEGLLERLRAGFSVKPEFDAPQPLAVIEAGRPLRSDHPVAGLFIVFAKRVMRRLLGWYVAPIATDQTRFNLALLRELDALKRRLAMLETPRPLVAGEASLLSSRTEAYSQALPGAGRGRTLVFGGGPEFVGSLRKAGVDAVGAAPEPASLSQTGIHLISFLEDTGTAAWSAIVLAGVLPCLTTAETLQVVPAAAAVLEPGGTLVLDAPQPSADQRPVEAAIDPAMSRWIPSETAAELCQAAGLEGVETRQLGSTDGLTWYAVVAKRSAA